MQIKTLALMLTLMLCSNTASAAVTAQVDRHTITINETINLMIEVSGDDSGEPDTSILQQDFDIVSRNNSSSYSLINGSMSSKSTWFLVLRPRHAGAINIPALRVGNKQTSEITIQVNKTTVRQSSGAAPQGNLWIDMSVQPKTVRVQQQAIITLRIYQAVTLSQAQLTEPQSDRAMIVRLGEDKNYQVNREGRNWTVTERRYALFPQQHGSLTLEPVLLNGSIIAGRTYASPFQSTRPVHVQSNALQMSVDTMPKDWQASTWLPAKQVELSENWPSDTFKVGDSITRTLTLRANGLSSSQLPELTTLLPDHLKGYADKPVLTDNKLFNGVHGNRQEKLAILATHPGTFILPAINITWWNTTTQTLQTASLPPRTFKVLATPATKSNQSLTIQPIQNSPEPKAVQHISLADPEADTWWKWLALFSTLGWLLNLAWLFYKSRSSHQTNIPPHHATVDISALKQTVLHACQQNQSKACEQALLNFAAAQWPNENIHNLTNLSNHCDALLAQEINALERHLYGNQNNNTWQAEALQNAFEQTDFSIANDMSKRSQQALPSLYPE